MPGKVLDKREFACVLNGCDEYDKCFGGKPTFCERAMTVYVKAQAKEYEEKYGKKKKKGNEWLPDYTTNLCGLPASELVKYNGSYQGIEYKLLSCCYEHAVLIPQEIVERAQNETRSMLKRGVEGLGKLFNGQGRINNYCGYGRYRDTPNTSQSKCLSPVDMEL